MAASFSDSCVSTQDTSANARLHPVSVRSQYPYLFRLRIENTKHISNLLKTIHFKDLATVFASENGLKITIEDCKCVQASAFLQTNLFSLYDIPNTDSVVTFKINMSVFLECLVIFADAEPISSPVLELYYREDKSSLDIVLEESGVVTECRIRTIDPDETLDFDFDSTEIIYKVIIRSEPLKELFAEFDLDSDLLEIFVSKDTSVIRFCTFGELGSAQYEFPSDSDVVDTFQCESSEISYRYKLGLLKTCLKALQISERTSLRADSRGVLSLQFLIQLEEGHTCFIEFYCVPDKEIEED